MPPKDDQRSGVPDQAKDRGKEWDTTFSASFTSAKRRPGIGYL